MTGVPVKVVWTREDEFLHDVFKPMTAHRIEGGLDGNGRLSAWRHQIAGWFGTDGAHDLAYSIPNVHVEHRRPASAIREGPWRSVDFSHNCFVAESFIDELASLAEADPYQFRRNLLADAPRHREGAVRVHRIVAVVDYGIVVYPDTASAQIEWAIAMGLSAALTENVMLKRGQIDARNFDRYQLPRFPEMPQVEVHFMPSGDAPGGIGEVRVPPVAPSLGCPLPGAR